ncbi:hypothetical protein ACEPAI_7745 [Sanghuangporus weigelae]
MSRTTSSKNIFTITKYSRATSKQQDNLQGSQMPRGDCDWQHHTQPVLRLLLETRKSAQGIPEQMRLRIVWSVSNGHAPAMNNKMSQQANVIFEDIDLLVVRKHIHPFPTQGLPLKAVFRDNMIGIRFLPPDAKSSNLSEYRRFQVTFQFFGDSAAFIESIRDVCPCKPSPVNNFQPASLDPRPSLAREGRSEMSQNTRQPQAQSSTQMQSQSFQIPSEDRFDSTLQCLDEGATMVPSSQPNMISDLPIDFAVPFRQSGQNISVPSHDQRLHAYQSGALTRHQSWAQQVTQMDLSSSCSYAPSLFYSQTLKPSDIRVDSRQPSIHNSITRESEIIRSDPNASRLVAMPTPPTSSQGPSATNINNANRSSRAPLSDESADTDAISALSTKRPLLESLYEACRLDSVPRNELEQLVAHIVREDGFADLLQKIDSLWQLKAIANL